MSRIRTKVYFSGCDHDPEETSKGFCWQCRIAELEAFIRSFETAFPNQSVESVLECIVELEAENRAYKTTVYERENRELKEEIENLKAIIRGDGGTKKVNLNKREQTDE